MEPENLLGFDMDWNGYFTGSASTNNIMTKNCPILKKYTIYNQAEVLRTTLRVQLQSTEEAAGYPWKIYCDFNKTLSSRVSRQHSEGQDTEKLT